MVSKDTQPLLAIQSAAWKTIAMANAAKQALLSGMIISTFPDDLNPTWADTSQT